MKKYLALSILCITVLFVAHAAHAGTLFRLPFSSNPGYISWYDHNSASGAMTRYDCGTGYNYDGHNGTDFASNMGTTVLAGASGSLYYRLDGCSDSGADQTCGGSYGNHVRISHPSDGKVSIYAHLKNGTVVWTQSILCGGSVGQSGNSGHSTGPHMHFELWQNVNIGSRIDFYGGTCGGSSYWVNQNNGWPTTTCQ